MEMKSESFKSKLHQGQIGESLIANWLKSQGYNILPVYEKNIDNGKGPQIFTATQELIAPDLLAFKCERVFWAEAKQKTAFTYHRITGKWTTGIDLRHYEDYLKVSLLMPWPLWLLFLHTNNHTEEYPYICPAGLFGRDLDYLKNHENHRSDKWAKGMVYWAHDTLKLLAPIESFSWGRYDIPSRR